MLFQNFWLELYVTFIEEQAYFIYETNLKNIAKKRRVKSRKKAAIFAAYE